jgi:hypothetical protein
MFAPKSNPGTLLAKSKCRAKPKRFPSPNGKKAINMNRDEMNEVKSTEADSGRCNHKWLVLGSTLAATHLVGWMTRGKGYFYLSGKYVTYNLHSSWVEACGNVSGLNRKPIA